MARLPSERYLMQQIGGDVILFEDGSEREIVRFDPANSMDSARALEEIQASDLGAEDASFACFWAGYFHAYAGPDAEMVRTAADPQLEDGQVVVRAGGTEVARFDPRDQNATAQVQKDVHDSHLIPAERSRAHFWCGFFYARSSEPEAAAPSVPPTRAATPKPYYLNLGSLGPDRDGYREW
jgi:hypothetical protein